MLRILITLLLVFSTLFTVSHSAFPLEIPKTLFVFWDSQIDKAPILVQLCVSKMRAVCEKQNWTLVVLNQRNLHQYIPNYETEFMQIRRHASHPDWKAALSDLIRLHVIAANGGVYMDITTILFEGLGWLDRLDQIPYLLTNSEIDKGVQPDCIVPYIAFYQNSGQTRDSEGRITNWLPGYQAWFMAAKKNATFIQKWRRNHQKHFQLSVQQNGRQQIEKGYFLRHNLGGDYLIVDKSAFQVIQQEQAKLDKHLTFFGHRKNVNKQLKILGLHGEFGPFSLYLGYTPREQDFVSLTIQQIEEKYFAPIHFFVKLTNNHRNFFDGCFKTLKHISDRFGYDQNTFEKFMASQPNSQDCNTVKFIVEGSVFGGLIKDNQKARQQSIFTITVQQRDQFFAYCKSNYHINLKQLQFYDNLYYYISRLIQVGELINLFHPWAGWIKYKFDEYMKLMFRESILPPRNWMGWLVQPSETVYWEKRYQKRLREDGDLPEMGEYHGLTEVFQHEHSEIGLVWMRMRMYVFEHRVEIITCVLHWLGFIFFFTLWSLLYVVLSTLYWILHTLYKYNIRPLIWVVLTFRQPQMMTPIKKSVLKYINLSKDIYQSINQQKALRYFKTALKFIGFHMFAILLGLGFFAHNTFILYNYDVVLNNGKIYEQEWVFLVIILLQNLFRFLSTLIGEDVTILPGIRFKFLYYLFLPVYYYFFGSELLSLVRPFENQNFSLAFLLVFCFALIVKLIEHESKYGVKKIVLKPDEQENIPKVFIANLQGLLCELTTWVERVVIFGLLMVWFTNLRFIRNSQGYVLARFMDLLAKSKLPWFVLLTIYGAKCILQVFNTIKNTQKIALQPEDASNYAITAPKNQRPTLTTTNLFNEQINSRVRWIKIFSLQALKSLILITKYILRAYTIHTLLFNQNIEYMISHVFQINFDHTFMKITFMTVHFAFVFISFMVEIYLEDQYFTFLDHLKTVGNKVEFGMDESLNEDGKGQHVADREHEEEVSAENKNLPDYKKYLVYISLCQIILFITPRLSAILKFYSFFSPGNKAVKFDKKDFQWNILLMMVGVLFGYAILMPLIRKQMRSVHSKANPHYLNGENELLPSQDRDIDLKQHQQSHY